MSSDTPEEKTPQDKKAGATHAQHGARSEINWEGGRGRQPYANQGSQETTESDNREVSEGNRGEESGRNMEQLDKARGMP